MRNALSELLRIAQLLVSSIEAEETERDTKRERERNRKLQSNIRPEEEDECVEWLNSNSTIIANNTLGIARCSPFAICY